MLRSEEENLLDCEEPRRYGRPLQDTLLRANVFKTEMVLANDGQPREPRFEDSSYEQSRAPSSGSQTRRSL